MASFNGSGELVDDGQELIGEMSVEARLQTLYGRQLMRPDYGLDLSPLVDRPITTEELLDIGRAIRSSLSEFDVEVKVDQRRNGLIIGVNVDL